MLVVAVAVAILIGAYHYHYEFTESAFNLWIAAILASGAGHRIAACLAFAGMIAASLLFVVLFGVDAGKRDFVRSFFGVHKIQEADEGQFRILKHGTIEHGAQRIRDADGKPVTGRPEPITYYHDKSPMVEALNAVARQARRRVRSMSRWSASAPARFACQTKPDDTLTYFEIDPAVVKIAKDANRFSFLTECKPDVKIVIGDARLTLSEQPDGQFDMILIDAFSSDAIPTHLLTKEAMAIYKQKIKPDGLILMHISNKHMALASAVAGIAKANGLVWRAQRFGRRLRRREPHVRLQRRRGGAERGGSRRACQGRGLGPGASRTTTSGSGPTTIPT